MGQAPPAPLRGPGRRRCRAWPRRSRRPAGAARARAVPTTRAPEAPSGWPIAIAPPLALTFSGSSSGQPARQASDCEAKASFSSTASDVVPADPGLAERLVRRLDRGDPEDVGVDAVDAAGDDPGQRLGADPLRRALVAEQQHRGAVVERRGVAGGHGAALDERRPQLRELLERGLGADALVALQLDPGDRRRPRRVAPSLLGGGGQPVAAQRELVLGLARDRVHLGQLLGAFAERDRPLLGHLRVDHPPAERGRVQRLVRRRESRARASAAPMAPGSSTRPRRRRERSASPVSIARAAPIAASRLSRRAG